ncbi:MAG: hypothetical protein Q8941_09955 [Bacteroidota bacterium]|nr:hypothetical protein [Bacteroidota bacterium]
MNKNLSLERLDKMTGRLLAQVILMRPAASETGNHPEKLSTKKAENEMPFFYTRPIFKSRNHDPL